MKILTLLLYSSLVMSDTKFHYGDKVTFKMDFFGNCKGTVTSYSLGKERDLNCKIAYGIDDAVCNSKSIYKFFNVCESRLSNE